MTIRFCKASLLMPIIIKGRGKMSKAKQIKTSLFDCIVQENKRDASTDMILLHGFGADATDLHGLYPFLSSLPIRNFYFPNGVMPANSVPYGRAWFPIDIAALEAAMMRGTHRDMGGPLPKAVKNLTASLEESLIDELKIEPENCIIGGFSQGSMMAVNLVLNSNHHYKALIQMSGTFLDRELWTQKIKELKKTPIFLSHGKNDALLNPLDADDLGRCFHEAGHPIDYLSFDGGHEIPMEVINDLKSFVMKQK